MADESQTIRGINWRETFPFTHIFRAFRIAVQPSKLMLGLIALLALYAGGRVLDGLWPARHLAVPGEVNQYEQNAAAGGSSDQFEHDRWQQRDAIEAKYAQRLLEEKIVADENAARAAAVRGKYLDDKVKGYILNRRQDRARAAAQAHDQALRDADAIKNQDARDAARRRADDAYNTAVSEAYHDAYQDWLTASQVNGVGLFHEFFNYESQRVVNVVEGVKHNHWLGSGDPHDRTAAVVPSIISFFTIGPVWLMRHHPLYFVLFTLLFLTIWAIFGGAIARIAAVHVARDEKLSVRAALSFSLGKFLSFVSAPLIPLIIVLAVGLVPLIAGLLMSIPWGIGSLFQIIITALFALVLAAGFVMTLVLLGTFGGFNLMYPTIAAEGSDSFDAISRSFSYVYARPWRMLFYTAVAVLYGALCFLFVKLFIWLMLTLTHHFVGAGMFASAPSTDPLWPTMWRGPAAAPGRLSYDIDFLTLAWYQDIAASLLAFWVYLVVSMLGAFAISFYFTANTIIYYLMRHEVDATEMDDVYLEQSEEDFADATAPPVTVAPAPASPAATVSTTAAIPPAAPGDTDAATTSPAGAAAASAPAGSGGPEVGNASDAPVPPANQPPPT